MVNMKTYARIVDGIVAEIVKNSPSDGPINQRFHPAFVAAMIEVVGGAPVLPGWLWDGTSFAAPPPAAEASAPPMDVSFWQFMMAAWKLDFITHAEALAAVRQRIMPPAFALAIAGLPAEAQMDAELKFAGITRMLRSDPMFALVVAANIATDEQIDGVFAVAAAIV